MNLNLLCHIILSRSQSQHYYPSPCVNFVAFMNPSSFEWLLDLSASYRVIVDLNNLSFHFNYEGNDDIMVGDGTSLPIEGN